MADSEALILSSKPKCKDINKYHELDDEWYLLGTELEIANEELEELKDKCSDPHRRLIKVFGVWLDKGKSPTYKKLLKALLNIGKRDVAEPIRNELGLTSSLDSLLKMTTKVKLSECTSRPVSWTEEIDTSKASEPILTDQRSISTVNAPSDSSVSHGLASMDKTTSTASCSSETSSRQLNQSKTHALSHDTSTINNSPMHDPMTRVSIDSSSEPAYKAMIHCHDKLVTALSTDILSISGILVAKEFIPPEVSSKMLLPTLTPQEKATSLVIAITEKIKLVPNRFQELITIFSEQTCTKDISIAPSLSSHVSCEKVTENTNKDVGVIGSTNQQYAVCEGHMYTTWATLDPEDKTDLEARLLNEAETIGKEFALLCWKARDSFEQRGITPQTLASALLDLKVYKDPSASNCNAPLLKENEELLMRAQSVHETFHAIRPHMSFFNYEILEFLIEGKGSEDDKAALAKFMRNLKEFCKRHVFEVPFTTHSNGHQVGDQKTKKRLHIKVTKHFRAAFLVNKTPEATPFTLDNPQAKSICSRKLDISLEDAKSIQRKLAKILDLNPSSLFLDTISEGSIILTFLLPICVPLAGLDHNPEIALLSTKGIAILCGPPGKPERRELIPKGIVMRWSPPEYGRDSLRNYVLYYQKKCEYVISEWQKIELSLETHICVSNLSDGETYIFKISTVSDAGTHECSDESDPIVLYNSQVSVNFKDIYTGVTTTCNKITSLALSLADPLKTLSAKKIISEEQRAEITLASNLSDQAMILSATIHKILKSKTERFQNLLLILSNESLTDSIMETLPSIFYRSILYVHYAGYLKFLYANLHSKRTSDDHWPPIATQKIFRLAMLQAGAVKRGHIDDDFLRMTITGMVDDILCQKYPVKLKNIFLETSGQRKVILLEGAPGCSKSTLSVYICQQWEKGQLFNQFQLVILIQLRDPAVQRAKCLADLLPCPDNTTAQLLAEIMMETKCRNVLFILDGWDELPLNLHKASIFNDLVNSNLSHVNSLCRSTVIVTSRPISSGDLYPHVSSRVEILGFTSEELYQFFTESLKGDIEAVRTLLERIEENPEVAGSCYLPLNATILVHLFKSEHNTLPTTLYGIFSSLVLNCIKRHLKLRTQYKDVSIKSLNQLPEFAKKPFSFLCRLAYDGVMDDKIIFASLPADVNTLSLLQGVESFIGREKAVSYSFIHLSIQELLAAWCIATQLSASDQVSKFNELFDKSRFSAVFRFYAAITLLRTPGIKDVVINIAKKYSRNPEYFITKEDKVLMVSLLHCLYEAQNPSLCESVAQQLQYGLNLSDTTLTPSDCLCVGYFLAQVCKMAASEVKVYLDNCSIDDKGCKYLVSGLHKHLDTQSVVTTLLNMYMSNNAIGHHGVHQLLKINGVSYLNLCNNDLLSGQDTAHAPIDTLAQQLKNNTTLRKLWLMKCGLNSQSAKSLAEALTTNKHLEVLNISNNALYDDGIQHLAHALRVNQGLKELWLMSCGMTNVGLECLAKSLQYNNVLNELQLWSITTNQWPNRLTKKVVPILTECLQNNHILTELVLPKNFKSSTTSIMKAVNGIRKRSGLPLTKVSVGIY